MATFKKTIRIATLTCFILQGTFLSRPADAVPFLTYCSVVGAAFNSDGTMIGNGSSWLWTAANGNVNRLWACKFATAQLVFLQGMEPIRMESGYFDAAGDNNVALDCLDNYRETVTGHASDALQQAMNHANQLGKTCILRVVQ